MLGADLRNIADRIPSPISAVSQPGKDMDTMPTATAFVFCHPIEITTQDIDAMGHVNNAVYLQWVQEAVVRYWQYRSPPQAQIELLWVALKHVIVYRLPLFLEDRVEAHVMATATRGTRASFTTLFKRGDDLVAEVRSSWCCVDATTRRPRRIASDIARAFLPNVGRSVAANKEQD